jgi:hypothetical protein
MAASSQIQAATKPSVMVPRGARYGRSTLGWSRRSSHAAMFGMQMPMR